MGLEEDVAAERQRLLARIRKENVPDLTQLDYTHYLRTALWKKIKQWVLARDDKRCVICHAAYTEMEVHHRSYGLDVLEGRRDDMLVTLCSACHERVEFHRNGMKRSALDEKEAELGRLRDVHSQIEQTGLPLSVEAPRANVLRIRYTGQHEFLDFYTVDRLMFSFILHFRYVHRQDVTIPLPFGIRKLHQSTGGKIQQRQSKQTLVTVVSNASEAEIRIAKRCTFRVRELLTQAVAKELYWRLHFVEGRVPR